MGLDLHQHADLVFAPIDIVGDAAIGVGEATLSALDFRSDEEGAAPNLFSKADYGRFIAALHRFDSMERF
ncbi:MAG TPA: hypothetical protein VK862_15310 [Afifellaceae bacterium]|nr:hypothetical protein [Afifellaceae bacterium]